MKQKQLEMVQITVLLHTIPPLMIFFGLTKNGNERQNLSSGSKTGLRRRACVKTQCPGDTYYVGGRRVLSYVRNSKTYYTEPTGLIGSIWYYRQELDDEEEDAEEGLPGVEGARRGLLPGHASAGHHKTIQGRQLFLLLNFFMLFM